MTEEEETEGEKKPITPVKATAAILRGSNLFKCFMVCYLNMITYLLLQIHLRYNETLFTLNYSENLTNNNIHVVFGPPVLTHWVYKQQ